MKGTANVVVQRMRGPARNDDREALRLERSGGGQVSADRPPVLHHVLLPVSRFGCGALCCCSSARDASCDAAASHQVRRCLPALMPDCRALQAAAHFDPLQSVANPWLVLCHGRCLPGSASPPKKAIKHIKCAPGFTWSMYNALCAASLCTQAHKHGR